MDKNKLLAVFLPCVFSLASQWNVVPSVCKFENDLYVFYLEEDYPLGEPISSDFPVKGENLEDIQIINGGDFVEIGNYSSTGITTVEILLIKSLTVVLDQPEGDKILFSLKCLPNGFETEVEIHVKDVNNHPPRFNEDLYDFSISESKCRGSVVNEENEIIVRDGDLRKSPFGNVQVTIQSTDPPDGNFSLIVEPDLSTRHGKFFVKIVSSGMLKYHPQGYTVILRASDGHDPTPDVTTRVTILIIDEDDQDPIYEHPIYISNLFLRQANDYGIQVKESEYEVWTDFSESSGFFLSKMEPENILAFDQDVGINTPLTYQIHEGKWRNYLELSTTESSPKIKIKKIDEILARQEEVYILLKVFQDNDESRQAHAMVIVNIHVLTEEPAVFLQNVQLLRFTKPSQEVYKITVSPANQTLTLGGKDADYFQLSGSSVLLNDSISSNVSFYDIDIEAKNDSPLLPVKNVIQVRFTVVDRLENQESLFMRSSTVLDVMSDTKPGTTIYRINTTKEEVLMEVISIQPISCQFLFDNRTGEIFLQEPLNVIASSCKISVLGFLEDSGVVDVTEVIINVVQKLSPQPSLFERSIYLADVMDNTPVGRVLLEVKTTDSNVELNLTDSSTECADVFSLESSGIIILNGRLSQDVQECVLNVTGTLRDRMELIKVGFDIVKSKRPFEPIFSKSIYNIDLLGATEVGKSVFRLNLLKNNVSITITGGDADVFEIEEFDLELKTIVPINSTRKDYWLQLEGKTANATEIDFTEVRFNVVHRQAALFQKSSTVLDVMSDTKPGTMIYRINTTSENVLLDVISIQPVSCQFSVDNRTGKIFLQEPLNFIESSCKIHVRGSLEESRFEDYAEVLVNVVLKLSPQPVLFERSIYLADVMDNTSPGRVLLQVKTTDSNVELNITDSSAECVEVFRLESSGEIILSGRLSQDVQECVLNITGTLRDRMELIKVGLSIVKSKRPFEPIFSKSIYNIDLLVGTEVGKTVFRFALLKDNVSITITSGDVDVFEIEKLELELKTKVPINSTRRDYWLQLEGKTTNASEVDYTEVRLNVVDRLEALFQKSSIVLDVMSDTKPGSTIYRINTTREHVLMDVISIQPASCQFLFDNLTGEIILQQPLNFIEISCKISVRGFLKESSFEDYSQVVVNVVLKQSPQPSLFEKSVYLADVMDNTPTGRILLEVKTTDTKVQLNLTDSSAECDVFSVESSREIILNGKLSQDVPECILNITGTLKDRQEVVKIGFSMVKSKRPLEPIFSKSIYNVDLPIATEVGKTVFRFILLKNNISITIIGGDVDVFEIGEFDLELKTIVPINSTRRDYWLQLEGKTTNAPEVDYTEIFLIVKNSEESRIKYFRKSVFKKILEPRFVKGEILLNIKHPNSPPTKFHVLNNESFFVIDNDGNISLNVNMNELNERQYIFKIQAIGLVKTDSVFDLDENQAVVLFENEIPPKFADSSPLYKVFLPSASFSDLSFDIKLKSYDNNEMFFITEQDPEEAVEIHSQSGIVRLTSDVTLHRDWLSSVTVVVQNEHGFNDSLHLIIAKLSPDKIITIYSSLNALEIRKTQSTIEKKLTELLNSTTVKLIYYGNEVNEIGLRSYKSEVKHRTKLLAAAFRSKDPIPFNDVKTTLSSFTEQMVEVLGEHSVMEYDDSDVDENDDSDHEEISSNETGILIGLILLGVFLFLILVGVLVLFLLKRLRPDLFDKLNPWRKKGKDASDSSTSTDCSRRSSVTSTSQMKSGRLECVETSSTHSIDTKTEIISEYDDSDINDYDRGIVLLIDKHKFDQEQVLSEEPHTSVKIPEEDYDLPVPEIMEVHYKLPIENVDLRNTPYEQDRQVLRLQILEGHTSESDVDGNDVEENDIEQEEHDDCRSEAGSSAGGSDVTGNGKDGSDITGSDSEEDSKGTVNRKSVVTFCETPEVIRL